MDNITHSLAGIWLAEALLPAPLRAVGDPAQPSRRSRGLRAGLYFAAILGNNLPDADSLYAGRLGARPLGYLLNHRGHSHTVLVALPLALVAYGLSLVFLRLRGLELERAERWRLALAALLGPLLHIAFDFTNNYGVHPFWPLYDGWLYGDAFFIIEPLFWAALIPPLLLQTRTLLARGLLALPLVIVLCVSSFREFVPGRMSLVLFAFTALASFLAWRTRPERRVWLAAALFALPALGFLAMEQRARSQVYARAAWQFPGETPLDLVTTPTPANPFCWNVTLVSRAGADYVVRSGSAGTWPALFPAASCLYEADEHTTAPHARVNAAALPALRWSRAFRAPSRELGKLAQSDCRVAAFLRFARVPYWTAESDPPRIVGDVRYDREQGIEFAEFALTPNPRCPRFTPPWTPPRADVLSEAFEPAATNTADP